MVEAKVNGVLTVSKTFSGEKDGKPWEMLIIKSGKPRDRKELVIFAAKPQGAKDGDKVLIKRIDSVSVYAQQDRRTQEWFDKTKCQCDYAIIGDTVTGVDVSSTSFEELAGDDGELPF